MHREALHYLDFDFSDEDTGRGSFDALASVVPDRLPAVLAEVNAVLHWAGESWGPAGSLRDEGDWDFLLHASDDEERPLEATYDVIAREARVHLSHEAAAAPGFITVGFTLTGSGAFCEDFRRRFSVDH